VFLLREWEKGKSSLWHQMLNNFSREIDILAFWSEEELSSLESPSIKKKALAQHKYFNYQYGKLVTILKKYPTLLSPSTYSLDNVTWLFIHLISRSFGCLNYITMVPFAEMFNHENTCVYFDIAGQEDASTHSEGLLEYAISSDETASSDDEFMEEEFEFGS